MKIVSNELKNTLKQPTTQRKGRILVNGSYYEVYNVEYYADAYNEGNVIGNAIASQLDFDLPYMDKFETFKYYDGVWTGNQYEYVNMGTFTVFDEQDEDEFNKHITAFDNLIKFNKPFEDVGGYPKTLYQELKNICNQAQVELENASIPNGNFIVENNQFVEGENLKTVLKAIEQISGTYGIIKNDKLVLQLKNQTSEKINKNEHEPITWKRRTYGINQVILGMEDVQGEYVLKQDDEDIAINGVHKLVINDNPFVYTQQKREQVIDELFNQVKGFGYVPYDLKMEWLNYMDIGDSISIDGIETLILRIYGKSPKSLESEMSAPAIIDSAVEYSNNTFSLSKRVSRTEFGVDKNAREIQGIVETTEQIQKEINPIKQESGSEIIIQDASDNPLTYLEIEGKSKQETRSGKNLWDNNNTINNSTVLIKTDTGFIYNRGSETGGKYYANKFSLKANTTYTFSISDNSDVTLYIYKDNVYGTNLKSGYNSITYTPSEDVEVYATIIINSGITSTEVTKIQFEISSTKTTFELYGVSPSPDYPSEIESVGYENLVDLDYLLEMNYFTNGNVAGAQYKYTKDENGVISNSYHLGIIRTFFNKLKLKAGTYTLSWNTSMSVDGKVCAYSVYDFTNAKYIIDSTNYTVNGIVNNSITFTITSDTEIAFSIQAGINVEGIISITNLMLEKGTKQHSYIPYGKYGIEVETVGKNLIQNWINGKVPSISTGLDTNVDNESASDIIFIKPTKTYTFSFTYSSSSLTGYILYYKNNTYLGYKIFTSKTYTFTPNNDYSNANNIRIRLASSSVINMQLEEGNVTTEYQPYQKNTSIILLNEPLRSLPNGVKDIAYIRNNKLYVDRYVGSVVLDGSENWQVYSDKTHTFSIPMGQVIGKQGGGYCSYFKTITASKFDVENGIYDTYTVTLIISCLECSSVEEFKTWLSTHNTEVQYELATPVTEELGEIEMLKTLKGYNNITTTDDLLPTINLIYVRDTIIADYVENHVAELKITENEIKESVESVSSSVDGLNTTINRVEEITTDNSQVINIISTNIDQTTGEVREVTTTTGFTFNADGMTIDDGSGFKAEHTAEGTYYKDGNSIVGQYTKDGSKQKDLELFGTYSYGKENINDTPMFVGQLYTDADGEQAFGHFFNGEG